MTKKHFIALADTIRTYNRGAGRKSPPMGSPVVFTHTQLLALADFCQSQNPRFNRARWLGYVRGENGPNGGKVKHV